MCAYVFGDEALLCNNFVNIGKLFLSLSSRGGNFENFGVRFCTSVMAGEDCVTHSQSMHIRYAHVRRMENISSNWLNEDCVLVVAAFINFTAFLTIKPIRICVWMCVYVSERIYIDKTLCSE